METDAPARRLATAAGLEVFDEGADLILASPMPRITPHSPGGIGSSRICRPRLGRVCSSVMTAHLRGVE